MRGGPQFDARFVVQPFGLGRDRGAGRAACPLGRQSAGDAVDSTDDRHHQRRADGVLEVAGALQDHRHIDQAGSARAVGVCGRGGEPMSVPRVRLLTMVAEAEGGAAEVFESAVDGLGRSLGATAVFGER